MELLKVKACNHKKGASEKIRNSSHERASCHRPVQREGRDSAEQPAEGNERCVGAMRGNLAVRSIHPSRGTNGTNSAPRKKYKETTNPIKTRRRYRIGWIGEAFAGEHKGGVAWASRFGALKGRKGRDECAAYVPELDAVLQIAAERWKHSISR